MCPNHFYNNFLIKNIFYCIHVNIYIYILSKLVSMWIEYLVNVVNLLSIPPKLTLDYTLAYSLSFPFIDQLYKRSKSTHKLHQINQPIKMALDVLEALDFVRTQSNHITAITIARMGFFTNAYNIFCISTISKLLGCLYYTVIGVALIGTLTSHLFFGWIGDKLGHKKAYSISLTLTIIWAICSGLSLDASKETVVKTLCFFRF